MAIVALPGGPAAEEPVPTDAVDGVDLRAYAAMVAQLSAPGATRAKVLASARLTEARWTAVETTWALRLATAMMRRDLSLATAYEQAFAEAMDAASRLISLPDLVAIRRRLSEGAEPAEVLAAAGTNAAEMGRAMRHWSAVAREDAEAARLLGLPVPAGRRQ